ncbi:MAG: DUF5110 domain-containing protein [Oscillospiraceae bacterium]|nr:DUF5110 domain-containing protein [Oscillospiraceae bacterium]
MFPSEAEELLLSPLTENCCAVLRRESGTAPKVPGPAFLPLQFADWTVLETEETFELFLPALAVQVAKADGRIAFYTPDGELLGRESGYSTAPAEVKRASAVESREEQTVDGLKTRTNVKESILDRVARQITWSFTADAPGIYGLGSHEDGFVNLRGKKRYFYQHNFKAIVPHVLYSNGCSILFDTGSAFVFTDDGTESTFALRCDDALRYCFTAAPDFDGLVQSYRTLTGAAVLLPKWAFGYFQSKEHYHTQEEVLEVAQSYRRLGIPLDCIVQDWQTWPAGMWGEKIFDPTRYPDPDAMTDALHKQNLKLMISIWPNMQGGPNNREMKEAGLMLPGGTVYNAFDAEGRRRFWKQAQEGLFRHGIDAWWCDCTEPVEADWNGAERPTDAERMEKNLRALTNLFDSTEANLFTYWHSRGIYEGQRQTAPERRVVNLTRSGYTGQQNYGCILWSGDISATWEELRVQVAEGQNFCAAGMPYWTNDAGAFFVNNPPEWWFAGGDFPQGRHDPAYREFYTRWMQYAAFLPIMRSHGSGTAREIYNMDAPGGMFYNAIAAAIRLRYSLMDYHYALAAAAYFDSYTQLRCLAFDFAADPVVHTLTDMFMYGDILVCPVLEPFYHAPGGAALAAKPAQRSVYLPVGTGWYDWYTDDFYAGGQWITAAAPLEHIPLFVRAGAILPLLHGDIQYAADTPESYSIEVYAGADGAFSLYYDANDGLAYQDGEYARIRVSYDDMEKTVTFGTREGKWLGYAGRTYVLNYHTKDREVISQSVVYTGEPLAVQF